MSIVLASKSRSRAALLTQTGATFETAPAAIDETALIAAETGADWTGLALRLARAKAEAVASDRPKSFVIGADQLLIHRGRAYETPASRAEAADRLLALQGETHHLVSGCVIARDRRVVWEHTASVVVHMRPRSLHEIEAYLDEVGDVAWSTVGAYAIEGAGVRLISGIEGDYFTALGLPLFELWTALEAIGALDRATPPTS